MKIIIIKNIHKSPESGSEAAQAIRYSQCKDSNSPLVLITVFTIPVDLTFEESKMNIILHLWITILVYNHYIYNETRLVII